MTSSVSKYLFILHVLITIFLVVLLLLAPIAVDHIQMDDTSLLVSIGWRGVNGYEPVIHYPHFYGGFAELIVITAFKIFGVSYKIINYAFVTLFIITALLTWSLCWKRLTLVETGLLTVLAAALILSLDPLEAYQRFEPAHSFIYNHVGVALMLALTVFACKEAEDRRAELFSSIAAGITLYVLVLTKATFGLIALPVLLACLSQKRWASAGLFIAGATIAMIALDFGMTRVLGSLDALLGSHAATSSGGYERGLLTAFLMLKLQAVSVAVVAILSFILLRRSSWSGLPLIGALFVCGLGYSAAMLATGGSAQMKLLPFLTVAALLLGKELTDGTPDVQASRADRIAIRSAPLLLGYWIILPATVTASIAFLQAVSLSHASLVSQGPLSRYVVLYPAKTEAQMTNGTAKERLAAAAELSRKRREVSDRDEYVMLADGVDLLRQVRNISSYGIISNGRMFDFTAPLQSKIVLSYPVWPTVASPELRTTKPLDSDVDLVMMVDDIPGMEMVTAAVKVRMGHDFRPCRKSVFWTLFVRHSLSDKICGTAAARSEAARRVGEPS
jgi:hypothetical protein